MTIEIRKAEMGDAQRVFDLSNDRTVRQVSFNDAPIEWEDHDRWYQKTLKDPACHFLLGFSPDLGWSAFVGQIRFLVVAPKTAEISISIHATFRGRGYGKALMEKALDYLVAHSEIRTILAQIKLTNEPSLKYFQSCGFQDEGLPQIEGRMTLVKTLKGEG